MLSSTRAVWHFFSPLTTTSKVHRKEKQNGYKQPAAFMCLECTMFHMQTWKNCLTYLTLKDDSKQSIACVAQMLEDRKEHNAEKI